MLVSRIFQIRQITDSILLGALWKEECNYKLSKQNVLLPMSYLPYKKVLIHSMTKYLDVIFIED